MKLQIITNENGFVMKITLKHGKLQKNDPYKWFCKVFFICNSFVMLQINTLANITKLQMISRKISITFRMN